MILRTCTHCKTTIRSHVLVIDNRDYCAPLHDPERVAERAKKKSQKKSGDDVSRSSRSGRK